MIANTPEAKRSAEYIIEVLREWGPALSPLTDSRVSRAAAMVKDHDSGMTYREIGKKHSISAVRVRELVSRELSRRANTADYIMIARSDLRGIERVIGLAWRLGELAPNAVRNASESSLRLGLDALFAAARHFLPSGVAEGRSSKLTDSSVATIRFLSKKTGLPPSGIATLFGVSQSVVSSIKSGSWPHVPTSGVAK